MLKKSKLFLALMLGGFMLTAIAFTGCNNEGEAKTETPAADTAAPKMESTPAPAVADTSTAPKMDTADTKPLKPGT